MSSARRFLHWRRRRRARAAIVAAAAVVVSESHTMGEHGNAVSQTRAALAVLDADG
jgi:hypothetical protein